MEFSYKAVNIMSKPPKKHPIANIKWVGIVNYNSLDPPFSLPLAPPPHPPHITQSRVTM